MSSRWTVTPDGLHTAETTTAASVGVPVLRARQRRIDADVRGLPGSQAEGRRLMYRPRHTRKDANHAEIVGQLRDLGAVVFDTADLGGDVRDLVVCWSGKCLPVEIKQPGHEDRLTDGERATLRELKRVGVPPVVATDVEDVMRAFGRLWELPR